MIKVWYPLRYSYGMGGFVPIRLVVMFGALHFPERWLVDRARVSIADLVSRTFYIDLLNLKSTQEQPELGRQ